MNVINIEQGHCKKIRSYIDSYINNELLVETNHEVLKHLEACAECKQELEARLRAKTLLQSAVRREVAPAQLRERIQRDIRRRSSQSWPAWTLAAAAAIVLLVAGWGVLQFLNKPTSPAPQVATTTPTPGQTPAPGQNAEILRIGFGNHVHCALDAKMGDRRFSLEEMAERIGPEFFGLVPLLKERVPAGYETVVAHECRYKGRQFRHIILRNGDKILSLVVTKKTGEAMAASNVVAALEASGIPIYQAQMRDERRSQQLEVAGFESRDYLVYVVSNLAEQENLQVASIIAPAVREFLARREA